MNTINSKRSKLIYIVAFMLLIFLYYLLKFLILEKFTISEQTNLFAALIFINSTLFLLFMKMYHIKTKIMFDKEALSIISGKHSMRFKWNEIENIYPVEKRKFFKILKSSWLSINVVNPQKIHKLSRRISGSDIILPDVYGIKPKELSTILNVYKNDYSPTIE